MEFLEALDGFLNTKGEKINGMVALEVPRKSKYLQDLNTKAQEINKLSCNNSNFTIVISFFLILLVGFVGIQGI